MTTTVKMKLDYSNRHGGINAIDAQDERGRAPLKEQFHIDAKALFRATLRVLKAHDSDWSGKVIANRAGVAVSGEVMCYLKHPSYRCSLYMQLSSIMQLGRDSDGLALLAQYRDEGRIVGANMWWDAEMDNHQLAEHVLKIMEKTL